MHVNTSHKIAVLLKLGHILRRKCFVMVFPSDVLRLLCQSADFHLAELFPTATHCCSCSFCLQAAYMLLSGTSVNHRVEAEQWQDIISIKYEPFYLNCCLMPCMNTSSSFVFRSSGSKSKLHSVALI